MARLSETSYSRDEVITTIRDYYHFLTKMYLAEDAIIEPPPSGWPTITAESMAPLDKNDEVIDLLRHLPYIDRGDFGGDKHVWARCNFADWRRESWDMKAESEPKLCFEGLEHENVPQHVVCLSDRSDEYGDIMLLDTKLGIINWVEGCPVSNDRLEETNAIMDRIEDYNPENERGWRSEHAWPVADYFKILKDGFLSLRSVPSGECAVEDQYQIEHPLNRGYVTRLQDVWRKHGWPDLDVFDKKACLEELLGIERERTERAIAKLRAMETGTA